MDPSLIAIMENVFNISYLATVWILVALMARARSERKGLAGASRKGASGRFSESLAGLFLFAFGLLALGDTFHVGSRVITWLWGAERTVLSLGGVKSSAVGLGMLATAYTVTGFYMVLAEARRKRRGGGSDPAFWLMEGLLGLRLVLMALPGNAWESAVPPFGMSLVRNAPLALAGFLMAALFIMEGRREKDRVWEGIGWAMVASYAFYTPVILFASRYPMLGLLMIPKTVAYVVMGFIAYRASRAAR